MTDVASTIADLGTPADDGTVAILRIGSGATAFDELLVWNDAQQAWIGRPRYSMRQIDVWGMQQNGDPTAWTYPNATDGAGGIDTGYGFQIHQVQEAAALYSAGLRLQERLTAEIRPTNGVEAAPRLALNWYDLDPGDGFLSPVPTNFGVNLVAENTVSQSSYHWYTTGWQNSPVTGPTARNWYPELYVKGATGFSFRKFTAEYRWVGGTVGATGGSDDSRSRPTFLTGLVSWHVADDIALADGSAVSQWPDQSGFARNLKQATGAKQPILKTNLTPGVNGHRIVRFDGVNDYLQCALSSVVAEPCTVFIVMQQFSGGGTQQIWLGGGTAIPPLFYRYDASNTVSIWGGSGSDLTYARSSAWPMPFTVMSAVFNGGSGSNVWENETSKVSGTAGSASFGGLTVGALDDGTLPAQIDVAEILMYTGALSDANRLLVIRYLNAKYAVY
jgi:hypothetical protein